MTPSTSSGATSAWDQFRVFVGAFVLVGVLVYVGMTWAGRFRATTITIQPLPTASVIAVHVSGAVATPGVYTLSPGARMEDAIAAAGGTTSAASDTVNRAAPLTDGERVDVPFASSQTPDQRDARTPAPGLIDLNTATATELETLPGIGPTLALRIVENRAAHGPFATVDDLDRVPGISTALIERIRPFVTVR